MLDSCPIYVANKPYESHFLNLYVLSPTLHSFDNATVTSSGNIDSFVVKISSSSGKVLWAKGYGGDGQDQVTDMAVNSDTGLIYLTGLSTSSSLDLGSGFTTTNAGSNDWFVVAIDTATSSTVWARVFGNSGNDVGFSVAWDSSSSVYIAGRTSSSTLDLGTTTISRDETAAGIFIIAKLDQTTGTIIWARSFGGPTTSVPYETFGVPVAFAVGASSTAVYLSGLLTSTSISFYNDTSSVSVTSGSAFLFKLDPSDGTPLWASSTSGIGVSR